MSKTQIITPIDTAPIEKAFEATCFGNLQITYRLELRRLATSLWYDTEMNKEETNRQNYTEPLRALTNIKANLNRLKKTSDALTSSRLMEAPENAANVIKSWRQIADPVQTSADSKTDKG